MQGKGKSYYFFHQRDLQECILKRIQYTLHSVSDLGHLENRTYITVTPLLSDLGASGPVLVLTSRAKEILNHCAIVFVILVDENKLFFCWLGAQSVAQIATCSATFTRKRRDERSFVSLHT